MTIPCTVHFRALGRALYDTADIPGEIAVLEEGVDIVLASPVTWVLTQPSNILTWIGISYYNSSFLVSAAMPNIEVTSVTVRGLYDIDVVRTNGEIYRIDHDSPGVQSDTCNEAV